MLQAIPIAVVVMFAVSWVRAQGDVCAHHTTNGCSIPLGAPFFYKQHFNSSCNRHDMCYGCGARYGLSREQCDTAFLGDMRFACTTITRRKRRSSSSSSVHRHKRTICSWFADQYYWAVSSFAELYFYEVHQTEPYCQEPWVKPCLPDPRTQPNRPARPPGGGPGASGGPSIAGLLESIGSQLGQAGNQPARSGQSTGQPASQSGTQPSIFGLLGRVGTHLVRSLSQPSQPSLPRQSIVHPNRSDQPKVQPSQPRQPGSQPNQPRSQPVQPSWIMQPAASSHNRQATRWSPQDEARLRSVSPSRSAQIQVRPRAAVRPGESVAGHLQSAEPGQTSSGQTSQQINIQTSQSTRQPGLLGLLGQVVRQLG